MITRSAILFLVMLSVSTVCGQTTTADAVTFAYKVVPGKSYLVSVAPEKGADTAIAVGFEPNRPMTVINNQGMSLSETYKVKASSTELQVAVFVNIPGASHTIAVIDEDAKFPFYKWRADNTVEIKTDEQGYVESFGFAWKTVASPPSSASEETNRTQTVAADSAISYKFTVKPGVAYDVFLIPETNHLDLAMHFDYGGELETIDYDRDPADIRHTGEGQIEWAQIIPARGSFDLLVQNKMDFAGTFRLVVRELFEKGPTLRPDSWKFLSETEMDGVLSTLRSRFPFVDEKQAVEFEILPERLVENYELIAFSYDPRVNFALVVRSDPDKPPMFFQASGSKTRLAGFTWRNSNGVLSMDSRETGRTISKGFPSAGKIKVSLISYGGSGRIKVTMLDTETLRELELPQHKVVSRETAIAPLSQTYEGFASAGSDFKLYRFAATEGDTYRVKVTPFVDFDPVIIDSSRRTEENPARLDLIDEFEVGRSEELELTAEREFIEFGVAGVRYETGHVNIEHKRLGGFGFFRVEVIAEDGSTPELMEEASFGFPNDIVSKELALLFQPWDDFVEEKASDYAPFSVIYDKRIIEALENPRIASK